MGCSQLAWLQSRAGVPPAFARHGLTMPWNAGEMPALRRQARVPGPIIGTHSCQPGVDCVIHSDYGWRGVHAGLSKCVQAILLLLLTQQHPNPNFHVNLQEEVFHG